MWGLPGQKLARVGSSLMCQTVIEGQLFFSEDPQLQASNLTSRKLLGIPLHLIPTLILMSCVSFASISKRHTQISHL